MREMKDSGYSWVGTIPTTWAMKKGKYLFVQRSTKGNKITLQLLSPTQRFGVIPQEMYEELTGMNAVKLNENVDLSLMKTIHRGDFCISLRSFQGGFEYSEYEGVVSPAYQVFYPIVSIADGYYKYLFKDTGFIEKMNSYTMTLRDGKNIAFADFGNTYIPMPPLSEQKRIADFLDGKCTKIDGLVADIQSQIDTLEQYKRSVITETVTKGLNPDAQMKDSGIEWVGIIPAHWRVLRIKNMFSIVSGATPSPDIQNWDGDIRWITPADYKTRDKYVAQGKRNLSSEGFNTCSTSIIPRGSIIFSKRAPIGTVAINTEELCTNQGCLSCIPITACNCEFFYYIMSVGTEHFELLGTGTTFKEISASNFANCKLPMPPFSEQVEIAHYLSEKVSEIDGIIDQKKEQLTILDSYKKSLIYEYVTGKKEVSVQ